MSSKRAVGLTARQARLGEPHEKESGAPRAHRDKTCTQKQGRNQEARAKAPREIGL